MEDIRLVGARRLVWNPDAWQQPGTLHMYAQLLNGIIDNEEESTEARAEAAMLLKQLYAAGKRPQAV